MNIYDLTIRHHHPKTALRQTEGRQGLLGHVPPNIVQSIRAFRVNDLQKEAGQLGHHFLYACCAGAVTRQEVLSRIAHSFHFPREYSKTFPAFYECLTRLIFRSGRQTGFLVVLEQLPYTERFDRDAREALLDVFRDAAEFWAGKQVTFRVFYSFQ